MIERPTQFAVGAEIYGSVVELESAEYAELLRFQDERFARLRSTRAGAEADASPNYTEAIHTSPANVVPIVMRRRTRPNAPASPDDEMVAIARMELPGATLIEAMIELRPGSPSAEALATGRAAEIGSLAAHEGVSRVDLIASLNALAGVLVELARRREIEWLWSFPRAASMSLIRAEIPGVLPPFHFTLSPDVVGWRPGSAQLAAFRAMHMRGFLDVPLMYQIQRETLAEDLERRLASFDQLAALGDSAGPLLARAMISIQRTLRQEVELLYPREAQMRADDAAAPVIPVIPELVETANANAPSFLPAELMSHDLSLDTYLRQVMSAGGEAAQLYKQLGYSLLDIHPGQRVLDVGCGEGVDLLPLARLAGAAGIVVGLDVDQNLVNKARARIAQTSEASAAPMLVFHGDAQQMTIPNGEFDRARTDRALQHFPQPERALAEMWRVLKPGGVVTLVEPDWSAMVISPGSATGEGDETLERVLGWCRQRLAHPLIGRNLHRLLAQMPEGSWQSLKVVVAPFTFSEWAPMDAVLLLSRAAAALQNEEPAHADEIAAWVRAVETASSNGSFFGYLPLFYATAVKSASSGATASAARAR